MIGIGNHITRIKRLRLPLELVVMWIEGGRSLDIEVSSSNNDFSLDSDGRHSGVGPKSS